MRKIFLLMLVAIVAAVSCQKSELTTSGNGGEVDVTISTSLNNSGAATRTITDYGTGTTVTRCIMEIYLEDGSLYKRDYSAVDANLQATFSMRLVSNQTYDFVFWADKTDDLETDGYYVTTNDDGLKNITVDYTTYDGSDEARDAFFGHQTQTITTSVALEQELKRPFGQLNVSTNLTDVSTALLPASVLTSYTTQVANIFNALSEETSGTADLVWTSAADVIDTPATDATGVHLSFDYIFAPIENETLVDFTMDFYTSDGVLIMSNDRFANIPIKRNYRTNVSGELLTVDGEITVTVNPIFEGEIDVIVPAFDSVEDLNEALASYEGTGDLVIELTSAPEGDIIIPNTFEANSISIEFTESDDSEISIIAEDDTYDGTVVIINSSDEAMDLTVRTPNADVTVSGSFSSFNVWSRSNTCVVLATASVEEIIVEQGNVSVYGTVGSIERSAENPDKVTYLSIFNGGSVGTFGEDIELIYVPDFYNYTTNTSYEDFTSLMAAAVTNDEVYVGPGTHTYSGNFGKSLTIYGANRDIEGSAAERNPETIFMDVTFYKAPTAPSIDLVLDGVEITGSSTLNYQGGGNVTVRNSIISSTTATAGSYPINNRVVYTDCTRISGNFLFENNLFKPADDVTLNEFWIWGCKYDASKYTTDVTAVIKNNVFNSTYVNVGFSNNVQIADSKIEITGNTFENMPYESIDASAGTANGTIVITDNIFPSSEETAIDVNGDESKYTISGNTYAE